MKRYVLWAGWWCMAIFSGVMVMTACTGKASGTYTWLAGGEGGGWYAVANEFARLIREKEPKLTINVIAGGGYENPVLLHQGKAEFAWGVGYVDRAAYNGTAPLFQERHTNLTSIAGTLSMDCYHFLAAQEQGIGTIEQLAGKIKNGEKIKLAVAEAGTSDYVMAGIILDFYDASFSLIEENGGSVIQAVYGDMTDMFINGLVDYAIVNLAIPGTIITRMITEKPSVLLSADNEVIDYCHYTWGTVARTAGIACIPAGTYPGIDNDVPVVCHSTEILVSPKLPESVVYTFTKILNENKAFLMRFSESYHVFDPQDAAASSVQVPLHPGAAKYYKEAGVLK